MTSTPSETSASSEAHERSAAAIMERVTQGAAVHGEGVLSYCRLFFCVAVLLRFLTLDVTMPAAAYVLNVSVLATGITFSAWALWVRQQRLPFTTPLWLGGIADALVAFGSLLQTALWNPLPEYAGLLTVPDPSIVPLLVFAASFRLSPGLAVLSATLNGLSLVTLFVVDSYRFGDRLGYGANQLSLFGLVFLTSAMASVLMAHRIRRLVASAALDSLRIESARSTMSELLCEQHDTRSLLSSVNLNAELVKNALEHGAASGDRRAMAWVDAIREDLARVNAWIQAFGERTFTHLAALREVELVDTRAVIPGVLSLLGQRFPTVSIESRLSALPCVRLAGGSASLQRILYNLVLNAAQGDEKRGARHVFVTSHVQGKRFCLSVEDDGPGFPAVAPKDVANCVSTKASGTGLGLYGISQLLEASGGHIDSESRPVRRSSHGRNVPSRRRFSVKRF